MQLLPFANVRVVVLLALLLAVLLPRSAHPEGLAPEVVTRLQQTVVLIDTDEGYGTGFVVSADGLVLTNAHVAEPGSLLVTFPDGRTETAEFVGFDPDGHDLAVLRLEDRGPRPYLPLADAGELRFARPVYAVGNPYPIFPITVSAGVLASLSERYRVMLIDAPVASGSSGSPVITAQGQVLGIVSAQLLDSLDEGFGSMYGSGFNTALDVQRIADFLAAVRRGNTSQIRQASFEWLTLPLPHLEAPAELIGRLHEDSDRLLEDRSFVDGYTVDLAAGETLLVEMSSDELDAYLVLFDARGHAIASNDDISATETDARIVMTVDAAGRYSVLATTYRARETGEYRLSLRTLSFTTEVETVSATLRAGRQRDAEIDWKRPLQGRPGQAVSITMHSDELDSYLELLDENGAVVAANDDMAPGELDARIVHVFTDARRYNIRATSFDRRSTGAFQLEIAWSD